MLLSLLLVIQIIVAVALVGVILLQRSEGGALGMGGGGGGGFMTARGAGDLLTKTTSILGAIFFILSIALTVVVAQGRGSGSVVDRLKVDALNPDALNNAMQQQQQQQPAAPAQGGPAGFQAPAPQVNSPALPAAPAPGATQDAGGANAASRLLGIQTAPQAPAPQPQTVPVQTPPAQ